VKNVPADRVGEVVQSYITNDDAAQVTAVRTGAGLYDVRAGGASCATLMRGQPSRRRSRAKRSGENG
jgi:hypothetical protein